MRCEPTAKRPNSDRVIGNLARFAGRFFLKKGAFRFLPKKQNKTKSFVLKSWHGYRIEQFRIGSNSI
jgi:hypothetical protein